MTDTQIIMVSIWSTIFIVTLITEILTINLVTIWFSIASLITIFVSIFSKIYWISIVVFAILLILFLGISFPLLKKYRLKRNKENINTKIGIQTILLKDCDNLNFGIVKINGVIYETISKNLILKNKKVEVIEIKGNKLVIKEVN